MKKGITNIIFSACLLVFYIGIIMYVFFAVIDITTSDNFGCAMIFEIIGFLLLAYFILGNLFSKPIKTGFFVPLILATVLYTIILDVINIALSMIMPQVFFILLNFVLLFIYCLVSIPMYIMGRR